ncbi:hypothetical protein AYO41_01105 [Verrucomicrobia bacterium SCGC AG-212-E04]|nr:hypothetical protein AYO41_01105 [Verrucomicrobia bacterium SCGC AG-212-E04]
MTKAVLFRRCIAIAFLLAGVFLLGRDYFTTFLPQASTWFWPETTGKITQSRVLNVGDEGYRLTDSHFFVRYNYSVGGREFTGTNYRLHSDATQGIWYAGRLASRFPVGLSVPIYYDPRRPESSVLLRGWSSEDGQMLLLIVPLVALIVMLMWGTFYEVMALRRRPDTAGLIWRDDGRRVELDVPLVELWVAVATIVFSIPLLTVIPFTLLVAATRNAALFDLVGLVWAGVIALIIYLIFKARELLRSRRWRVAIDRTSGQVELPDKATNDGVTPRAIPLADVTRFLPLTMEQQRRKMAPRKYHAALIEWRDPGADELRQSEVFESDYPWRARRVADWLEKRRTEYAERNK